MKIFLKYGGLLMSSILTISLFIRLFGLSAYGVIMSISALALFEGGAIAWSNVLLEAKGPQRPIAKFGTWFCVVSSIASSSAEIILATRLWEPQFDIQFVTLLVIVGALATNVLGIFALEQNHPSTRQHNRELDRAAKARETAEGLQQQVIDSSLLKAESKVQEISGAVSTRLAEELQTDVTNYLLSGVHRRQAQQVYSVTAPVEPVARLVEAPKAGVLKAETKVDSSLTSWSLYSIVRALVEQRHLSKRSAYEYACQILGFPTSTVSDSQLESRMARVRTMPDVSAISIPAEFVS